MKKLGLLLVVALLLVLCVSAVAEGTLVVYNAYDYIDDSVLDDFEKETGIKIKYVNFTTCEEMYTKMTKGGSSYDVIFPSDYIIERLIKEDLLAEIDYSQVPNAAGILDWMNNSSYDPGNVYSVPYQWGTVGILYNTEMVEDEITSWESLFDPQYHRDVFMLDSLRESMGLGLKYLGYELNCSNEEALEEVTELLIQQQDDGIVQGYLVDEVKDKMVGNEAAMAVMWSGDAMYAIMDNDALKYVIPEEGSNIWVDAMCIPKSSQNYEEALMFINYICSHDVAMRNYDYIHYAPAIASVYDEIPEEELANEAVNPSEEALANCEFFHDIMDIIDEYNKFWMQVRA